MSLKGHTWASYVDPDINTRRRRIQNLLTERGKNVYPRTADLKERYEKASEEIYDIVAEYHQKYELPAESSYFSGDKFLKDLEGRRRSDSRRPDTSSAPENRSTLREKQIIEAKRLLFAKRAELEEIRLGQYVAVVAGEMYFDEDVFILHDKIAHLLQDTDNTAFIAKIGKTPSTNVELGYSLLSMKASE